MQDENDFTTQPQQDSQEHKCCCGHNHHKCHCAENAPEGEVNTESTSEEHHECHCKQNQLEELQNALLASQEEAKKNYDSYLRTAANLDTFRRRVQRDMEDLRKFAIQPLVEELLPAIDNLELGLEHAKKDENVKDLTVGIEMVLVQIKKVFASFGIEEIKPLGEDFDPNFHECVSSIESSEFAENKVAKIMRTGYKLNGRLVRPASVVVSKGEKKE